MHPPEVKQRALELVAEGLNDCEVSRRLGVPRSTVRDWRRPIYVPRNGSLREPDICPRCWCPVRPIKFTPQDYSELLGLYLGDGCISILERTQRLRITLDLKYPRIIEDARRLLARALPGNAVDVVPSIGCVHVSTHSSHLTCLFPQHGPGRKHERPIMLETWQEQLLEQAPWTFIRGCIRSDGCAFINRTGPYEYLSYEFSNMSGDIARLFAHACDLEGVEYRVANGNRKRLWDVRINRRDSVALMLEHVGLKR